MELDALAAAFQEMMARQRDATEEQLAALRSMLEGCILGRGMLAGSGTFLTGLDTYLMKLGPDNLGSYAADLDRQIARALGPVSMRMRLQNVTAFMAEARGPGVRRAGTEGADGAGRKAPRAGRHLHARAVRLAADGHACARTLVTGP